jgi:hypothetical protein
MTPTEPCSVPVELAIQLAGAFAQFPLATQEIILQWMLGLLSFSGFNSPSELRVLYPFFVFHLPETTLRPWLCELLYRLTTKQEVQTSTINRL